MNPTISGLLAVLLYLVGTGLQFTSKGDNKRIVTRIGLAAVLFHGVTSYLGFYTDVGIDLGLYPMLSLTTFAVAAILCISSFRLPVESLFVVIFPVAVVSILLQLSIEGSYTPRDDISRGIGSHIVLSVFAYGLLSVAALQAAFLSFGNYELRHRKLEVVKKLPPLETMEALLFEMLGAGLVLLSLSILTGFIFLQDIGSPGLIHHTGITMAAWAVFAVLLWGRIKWGWRGAVASRWALSGFALLALGYFGSKLVLEVILGRV
ncbi:MAG TPA: hypothetical protein DCM54_05600 [Gammaproteobacteria bacterium]|nr:hypothetical protein [Gammaproteobacteria bacterium]|tara:strand:- start:1138 stop:1926 length:789 start_codon:yes stop_codon:yes gene_type:complete